ncbi:hypothetical protein N7532_003851 [Penicillium argentinense]|uniref:Structure-specific endonuclease subunit SLX4 n=1 Tax=Penicillium argentinense TaxID=1131581 RepID=A0A9W9KFK8_9EURO|nr:uncharacterized protein N7532_003851 [Penicillium argentinense]KAJ5103322.1 hypothetical protein N7532_003851 [Penicillium argentinense]
MASSAEVIVLSSSPDPPKRTPKKVVALGSERFLDVSPRGLSPHPIPSPSDLFNPPSRSRFFPTPNVTDKDAIHKRETSKKTALSVSRNNNESAKSKLKRKPKKAGEKTQPNVQDAEPQSLESPAAGSKSKNATSQNPRSKTSTKKKETGNMKLTGKVTKGGTDTETKKPSKAKKMAAAGKAPSEENVEKTAVKERPGPTEDKELNLVEALRRRMDWTPPRRTSPKLETATEDDRNNANEHEPKPGGSFGKLLSDYSFSGATSAAHKLPLNMTSGGPTKRRRIELVDPFLQPYQVYQAESGGEASAQVEGDSQPKKKPKAPKRYTTLTARMTAQYTPSNEHNDPSGDDSIQHIAEAKPKRTKARMKENEVMPIVLSPEAAFKSLEDQDLIFGTCSQLDREDSPPTMRETQQASHASESLTNERRGMALTIPRTSSSVSRMTGTRNLWEVAARSAEGSLVQAKATDSVDLTSPIWTPNASNAQAKQSMNWENDDWFELDYGQPKPPPKKKTALSSASKSEARSRPSSDREPPVQGDNVPIKVTSKQTSSSQQPCMPHYSGFTDAELSKQVATFGFKSVRGRKKMIELLQKCWESKHGKGGTTSLTNSQAHPHSQSEIVELPASTQSQHLDSRGLPVAQTPKPKTKADSKLDKDATSSSANTVTQTKPTSTKNRLTTLQKATRTSRSQPSSFIDIEEIQDSEEEVIPSPSQTQKRYNEILLKTPKPVKEPSLETQTKEPTPSPSKRKTAIFKSSRNTKKASCSSEHKTTKAAFSERNSLPDLATQITKAVRSQSRLSPPSSSSGSRICPTWHEKILMYDPIILEEFTIWLNVEGLSLVGEDREVHVAAAREWCESKGICCCGKNNASW